MQVTNDVDVIPDWAKIALTALSTGFTVFLGVIKQVKHPLEKDLNGLGRNLSILEQAQGRLETRMDENDKAMLRLQNDIMTAISASGAAQMAAINQVAIQVGRLDERMNIKGELVSATKTLGEDIRRAIENSRRS